MRGARQTTIIDVAREAGVSPKTVSRVLNNEPHVRPDLQQRVRDAATELNYHPNILAQGLVRRRSFLIGLVYENPSPSYVVELQRGVLARLESERYRMVVIPIHSVSARPADVVGLLRAAALDGVILAPPACDHAKVLGDLDAVQMPYARIAAKQMPDLGARTEIDDVSAASDMARYLLELGHRRIVVIAGDPTHGSTDARMEGYLHAFESAGLSLTPDRIEPGMYTYDSGYEAAKRCLSGADRPTAILAMNDDMAVGAMMAARDLGLEVPRDLSIVGFDDSEVSRITWPRITTVRQPVYDMAVSAADMLLNMLEGKPGARVSEHGHSLCLRDSTAPPPNS